MKKNLKKLISLTVGLMMTLSLLPQTMFTAVSANDDIADIQKETASGEISLLEDETVTIGTGTGNSKYAPYCGYYRNSGSQMIYKSSEIGSSGTITAFAFDVAVEGSLATTSLTVYMGHTSLDAFTSTSAGIAAADLTLVYSGTPTIGTSTGWETITLDTPFEYDSSQNLVVAVYRQSSAYNSSLAYYYTSTANGTVYRQSDYTASYGTVSETTWNGTAGYCAYRPNIQLTMEVCSHENKVYSRTVAPTCTEQGYDEYICSDCGKTVQGNYVEALGHSWDGGTATAPTCTEQGYTTYTCTREGCGATEKADYTAALGHTYVDNSVVDNGDGTHNFACSVCSMTSEACTYADGICTICGASQPVSVKVGTSTSYSTYYVPFMNNYNNAATEQLYTAAEIGTAGYITELGWQVGANTEWTSSIKIYMGHTSAAALASSSSGFCSLVVPDSGEWTLVYDGSKTFGSAAVGDYETIQLDTPFLYNGQDNLVIAYVSSASTTTSALKFYYTSQTSPYMSMYKSNTTDGIDTTSLSATAYRPNTEINMIVHSHTWNEGTVTAPTCTEQGYTTYACTTAGCTASYKDNYTDALGHIYVEGSCRDNGNGTHSFSCSREGCDGGNEKCNYVDGTCSVCGAKEPTAVTVGTGSTGSNYSPYYSYYYKNAATEMLYTADEIGNAGKIQQIAFSVNTASAWTMSDVQIYMGETTANSLSSSVNLTTSDMTLVYDGALSVGEQTGWEPVTLDTAFNYGGENNLVIAIVHQASDANSSLKYDAASMSGRLIYKTSASSAVSIDSGSWSTSSYYSYLPNVQFMMQIHEHSWEYGTPVEATCTTYGYTPAACSECGITKEVNIVAALGHSYNEEGVCTRCGDEKLNSFADIFEKAAPYFEIDNSAIADLVTVEETTIDDITDNYGKLTVTSNSTTKTVTMTAADDGYLTIPVAPHNYAGTEYYSTYSKVTVSVNGTQAQVVNAPSSSTDTMTSVRVHVASGDVVTIAYYSYSSYYSIYMSALEFTPDCVHQASGAGITTDPTCTEKGYTTYTCSVCGKSFKSDYVDALGHNMEYTVTDPTCEETGNRHGACTRCDYTTDEVIPANGHSYENGYCTVCHAKAASSAEIGTGTSSQYYTPYNCYQNSSVQLLYTAAQVGGGGTINSIAFNCSAASTGTADLKIWMGTTSKTKFSGTSDGLKSSELTLVYENSSAAFGTTTGWETVTLDTPYAYDGANSLVIVISAAKTAATWNTKYYSTSAASQELHTYSTATATGVFDLDTLTYGSPGSYLPDIRIGFQSTAGNHPGAPLRSVAAAGNCIDGGNKAYYVCDTCGRMFSDENGTGSELTAADITIAAGGTHNFDENGICTICGTAKADCTHADAYVAHTEAKAAACTETGNIEYWYCSNCQRYFSDAACTTEITLEDTVTAALGHDYVDHDGQAATCVDTGWEAYQTCSRCDYTSYQEIPATGIHTYAAVDNGDGDTHSYKCSVCGSAKAGGYAAGESVTQFIPGHSYVIVASEIGMALSADDYPNNPNYYRNGAAYDSASIGGNIVWTVDDNYHLMTADGKYLKNVSTGSLQGLVLTTDASQALSFTISDGKVRTVIGAEMRYVNIFSAAYPMCNLQLASYSYGHFADTVYEVTQSSASEAHTYENGLCTVCGAKVPAFAASLANVTTETVSVGEIFTADVVITGDTVPASAELNISVNSDVAKIVSITVSAGTGEGTIDEGGASGKAAFYGNTASASEGLTAATVSFMAVADGTASITVSGGTAKTTGGSEYQVSLPEEASTVTVASASVETMDLGGNYKLAKYKPQTAVAEGNKVMYGEQEMYLDEDGCWYCAISSDAAPVLSDFTVTAGTAASYADTADGDVTGNGRTNIIDAQAAYDIATGVYTGFDKLSPISLIRADVNKDKKVDASDARAIQIYVHTGSYTE